MAKLAVVKVYANSLFQVAKELGKEEELFADAKTVLGVLDEQPEFREFIVSLVIPSEEKKKAIEAVFGGQIERELINLMFVMVDKGRVRYFSQVIDEYDDLLHSSEGILEGIAVSAAPLSEEQIMKLEADATKLFRQPVELKNEIDHRLIGGVKLMIDGKILDASLRSRLDALRTELIGS